MKGKCNVMECFVGSVIAN